MPVTIPWGKTAAELYKSPPAISVNPRIVVTVWLASGFKSTPSCSTLKAIAAGSSALYFNFNPSAWCGICLRDHIAVFDIEESKLDHLESLRGDGSSGTILELTLACAKWTKSVALGTAEHLRQHLTGEFRSRQT